MLPNAVPPGHQLHHVPRAAMAAWLVSLVVVMPGVSLALSLMGFGWRAAVLGAIVTTVGGTLAHGWSLGVRGSWRRLVSTALSGTAALALVYVAVMFGTRPSGDVTDTAAGAGLVVLGVPALLLLTLLLAMGAGSASVVRHLHPGPGRPTTPQRPDVP